jgi:hypothetical protein
MMTLKQSSATGVNRVAVHLVFPSMTAALQHTSDAMIRPLHETQMGNVLYSALHDSFSPSTHILNVTFLSDFDTFRTKDILLHTTGA